ncbi:phage tail protein [Pseudomonas sp. URMO17WK12:I2]|uniref:phage tail protein n=1 Tax=Pseudomonas sp. URMO17WK12:I2 TaxID=1261623 RepID=UPI000DACB3FB|nr:phage tail protein [Pseudomonas sp. URMO17WK12:I2]PZW46375.1 tail completion protein R (GpR) [Pseudomonas sp. URMO17WK12:I2]
MNKPNSLREHLLAKVPSLAQNPDRLLIFIDEGTLRCTSAASLSWEYGYTLQVILTDFAAHPDTVMLPLLGWLTVHQNELLANLTKSAEGIAFEADVLDGNTIDLALKLPLTERVVVGKDEAGATTLTHPAEPQPMQAFTDSAWPPAGSDGQREWYLPDG